MDESPDGSYTTGDVIVFDIFNNIFPESTPWGFVGRVMCIFEEGGEVRSHVQMYTPTGGQKARAYEFIETQEFEVVPHRNVIGAIPAEFIPKGSSTSEHLKSTIPDSKLTTVGAMYYSKEKFHMDALPDHVQDMVIPELTEDGMCLFPAANAYIAMNWYHVQRGDETNLIYQMIKKKLFDPFCSLEAKTIKTRRRKFSQKNPNVWRCIIRGEMEEARRFEREGEYMFVPEESLDYIHNIFRGLESLIDIGLPAGVFVAILDRQTKAVDKTIEKYGERGASFTAGRGPEKELKKECDHDLPGFVIGDGEGEEEVEKIEEEEEGVDSDFFSDDDDESEGYEGESEEED